MLAIRNPRRTRTRRGAILLVVLAMLALFAVVALSFVLYAESEATSMRNGRAARNGEADPNPQEAANDFLGVLIFDQDPYDIENTSALKGHGLSTAKYGWNTGAANLSPYSGIGIPSEDVSAYLGVPGPFDRRSVVNFTRNTAGTFLPPNKYATGAGAGTFFNKSTPYTYADRANFYLAMQNPLTGEIVQPSFHRPDLFGSLDSTNPNWTNDVGRYMITRPRPGPNVLVGDPRRESPNFPLVPANADGTVTGDVPNMKFIAGASQKNDSLWMYAGSPVKAWRNKRYVAMVAPLVLDLNGRVNMSVAGNNLAAGAHASNHGFGAWEVNPLQLGISAADMRQILFNRYGGSTVPPNFYTGSANGTINRGGAAIPQVPPQYSRLDTDGVNGGPGVDGPMYAPLAGTYNPFLQFTDRFASTQGAFTTELTNHPQVFNPFHRTRGMQQSAHAQGMDDLVKLAGRYSDPKKRFGTTEFGMLPDKSFGDPSLAVADTAAAQQIRALTTGFNVTQSWAEVRIATNGGFAILGPIDLNRPLGDYRTNTVQPYSPSNVDALTPSANYAAARANRQSLATDIFLRLAALSGLVDGANVTYNPSTHCFNPVVSTYAGFDSLRRLAQYSANIVDAIDNDDIMTTFVWNPIAATPDPTDALNLPLNTAQLGNRVVYGTELNRLVINEAYSMIDNNRNETPGRGQLPPQANGKPRAAKQSMEKKFWIELHNPLPIDPVNTANLARLQYVNGVSPGTSSPTHTYPVYLVEVAEITPPAVNQPSPTQPLYNHLVANPSNVLGDPSLVGAPLVTKLRVNNYTYDATPTTFPAKLVGDELNIVRPNDPTLPTGPDRENLGYYVLGPVDEHPSKSFKSSMRLPDPPVNAMNPGIPENAMVYDTYIKPPGQADIDAAKKVTSTVVLRRLANPYLPPQQNANAANYNPYITVDFLENVPTRDRVQYNDMGPIPPASLDTAPSIGRRHPYANMPAFVPAMPDANMVVQQTLPAGPPNPPSPAHSFFSTNYTAGVQNPGGMAAFIHFDRELINSSELMHISIQPPHMLTAKYSDGVSYNLHTRETLTSISALLDAQYPALGTGTQLFKAFDLLTTANRMPGIPLGGREPGKINLNTVAAPGTDPRVLRAVLDPQPGNSFGNLGDVAWQNTIIPTRTPNWPAVRGTADETGAATGDRPFKLASGAATFDDMLFRSQTGLGGAPMLFNTGYPNSLYLQSEAHRKAWNNLTTVSDGFLVIWTVGFFEVDSPVGAPVLQFGKELFDKVPGDLRAQYSAVVDRSAIQVPPQTPALPATPSTNGLKAWETRLISDVQVGSPTITVEGTFISATSMSFIADGQAILLPNPTVPAPNASLIRLGYGNNRAFGGLLADGGNGEWVKAGSFAVGPQVGTVTITLDTASDPANYPGIQRFHGGSTRVSNTIPGNPGPQPLFDAGSPLNRHLVPYFTQMAP